MRTQQQSQLQALLDVIGTPNAAIIAEAPPAEVWMWVEVNRATPAQQARLDAAWDAYDAIRWSRSWDEIKTWFSSPNPALGLTPIEALQADRLSEVVAAARASIEDLR